VNYGSSDSEDEEVPVQVQKQTPVKLVEPEKPAKIPSELRSSSALGSSLLASDFQLRMLSKQRSRAAKDGSKKRIFITAPSLDEDDFEETPQGPKKPKIQKSTKRSQLFSSLPKPQKSSVSMSSKVEIDVPKKSTPEQELPVEPPKPVATTTSLMPNSVKKKIKKPKKPAKPGPSLPPTTAPPTEKDSDSDLSDNEGGFFSFTSREEDEIELKKHKLNDVGPSRPSRDMLRKEREKFTIDPAQEVNYETTRHPNEEDAIAPYGSDVAGYQAIAGPIRRASESFEESDAGLDIEGAAIRKLQGRRREEVQFVDAQVDKSLGNIRENIRKGAHQKHISTSIVDPLKEMKKSDPNAHVSKRTHQLKYLVELAKANETRLNQLWSNAKQSSRTTAQKYGW